MEYQGVSDQYGPNKNWVPKLNLEKPKLKKKKNDTKKNQLKSAM